MNTIQSVRDSIKHNVSLSREICSRIRASKGRERYDAWEEKRRLGSGTRYLLLALAFLRKRPYKRAEPHTATPVDAHVLAGMIGNYELHRDVSVWLEASAEQKAAA